MQARADSTGTPDVREEGNAPSHGLVQDARSSVVAGIEDAPREASVGESETIERAIVVEAVERAMHAFGVGRLDLAFEALRGLLKVAREANGT